MSETTAAGYRLPTEVLESIDGLRSRYPTEEALLLPALHLVQKSCGGWLPPEAIAAVADLLHLPAAKVANATATVLRNVRFMKLPLS